LEAALATELSKARQVGNVAQQFGGGKKSSLILVDSRRGPLPCRGTDAKLRAAPRLELFGTVLLKPAAGCGSRRLRIVGVYINKRGVVELNADHRIGLPLASI
jgi:hypothetical protein